MNKAITTKKSSGLELMIKGIVIDSVQEVLMDPDFGLEIQEWVKKRLKQKPSKLVSFERIKNKVK